MESSNILDLIEEELFMDNIDSDIVDRSIQWKDNFGAENSILESQTASSGSVFAWWQINGVGKDMLRIRLNSETIINWRPPLNTMGAESSGCNFLEFISHFLIVKYRDKHRERIFIINTQTLHIEALSIPGYKKEIKRLDDILFVKSPETESTFKISFSPEGFKKSEITPK